MSSRVVFSRGAIAAGATSARTNSGPELQGASMTFSPPSRVGQGRGYKTGGETPLPPKPVEGMPSFSCLGGAVGSTMRAVCMPACNP